MTEEKLDFTRKFLVWGSLSLLAWVLLSFFSIFFYNQIYAWFYLFIVVFIIYAILRRQGCSSCYKCKSCTSGFGRLAGVFFGKGYVKRESVGNRRGLAIFVYIMLIPLPMVILSISLLNSFSYFKVLILGCLLAVAVYSLTTLSNGSTTNRKS